MDIIFYLFLRCNKEDEKIIEDDRKCRRQRKSPDVLNSFSTVSAKELNENVYNLNFSSIFSVYKDDEFHYI